MSDQCGFEWLFLAMTASATRSPLDKGCVDERLGLVFLHRRADPVAPGWEVISIGHSVPRKEGHPIFRGAVLHHSLRMKGHRTGVGGSGPPLNVSVRAKALALVKLGRYALQHADSLLRHAFAEKIWYSEQVHETRGRTGLRYQK